MKSVDTGDTQNSAKGSGDIKSRKEMLPPDFQTKSESGESKEKKMSCVICSFVLMTQKHTVSLLSAKDV